MTEPKEQAISFTRRVLIAVVLAISTSVLVVIAWKSLYVLLLIFAGTLFGIYLHFLKSKVARYTRLPPSVSLIAVIILIILIIGLFIMLLIPVVQEQTMTLLEEIPKAFKQLRGFIQQFGWGEALMTETRTGELAQDYDADKIMDAMSNVLDIFSTTFGAVTGIIFIVVIGIYIGAELETYFNGILHLIPPAYRSRGAAVMHRLGYILRWWLLGQSLSMLLLGTLVFLGLLLLDIPYAMVLALLTAVMTFIPNLGPVISFVPTILVTLAMEEPVKLIYVTIFYVIVQTIEGFFITPMVHRKAITVPPMIIISIQVLLFQLIGFLGVILAMPLVACAMVLIQMVYVESILGDDIGKRISGG